MERLLAAFRSERCERHPLLFRTDPVSVQLVALAAKDLQISCHRVEEMVAVTNRMPLGFCGQCSCLGFQRIPHAGKQHTRLAVISVVPIFTRHKPSAVIAITSSAAMRPTLVRWTLACLHSSTFRVCPVHSLPPVVTTGARLRTLECDWELHCKALCNSNAPAPLSLCLSLRRLTS